MEEPGYENIKDVTKTLIVVDLIMILPSEPVYILPTSEFLFKLVVVDMDTDDSPNRQIKLPDPQYAWSTAQEAIGFIGNDGLFRSKINEGEAEILVVDQTMKNNTAEGNINVVHPYRLEVSIRDVTEMDVLKKLHSGDNVEQIQAWSQGLDLLSMADGESKDTAQIDHSDTHILIEEHYYMIKMHLYDKNGNLITLTDNLRFESLNLDERYLDIIQKNKIGSEVVVKTKTID